MLCLIGSGPSREVLSYFPWSSEFAAQAALLRPPWIVFGPGPLHRQKCSLMIPSGRDGNGFLHMPTCLAWCLSPGISVSADGSYAIMWTASDVTLCKTPPSSHLDAIPRGAVRDCCKSVGPAAVFMLLPGAATLRARGVSASGCPNTAAKSSAPHWGYETQARVVRTVSGHHLPILPTANISALNPAERVMQIDTEHGRYPTSQSFPLPLPVRGARICMVLRARRQWVRNKQACIRGPTSTQVAKAKGDPVNYCKNVGESRAKLWIFLARRRKLNCVQSLIAS